MFCLFNMLSPALRTVLLVIVISASIFPSPAQSQICTTHERISAGLKQKFGEEIQAIGITSVGALIEIYTSPYGTWTVVLTIPNGPSCVIADGVDFQIMLQQKQPQV